MRLGGPGPPKAAAVGAKAASALGSKAARPPPCLPPAGNRPAAKAGGQGGPPTLPSAGEGWGWPLRLGTRRWDVPALAGSGRCDSALGRMGSEHAPAVRSGDCPGVCSPLGTCLGELGMAKGADGGCGELDHLWSCTASAEAFNFSAPQCCAVR